MKMTTEDNRYRMFEVCYKGPTNSRGSRVLIKDLRHGTKKTIPYDHSMNRADDMAEAYLKSIGIPCEGLGLTDNGPNYILSTDFATALK